MNFNAHVLLATHEFKVVFFMAKRMLREIIANLVQLHKIHLQKSFIKNGLNVHCCFKVIKMRFMCTLRFTC